MQEKLWNMRRRIKMKWVEPNVTLLSHTPDPEILIEQAGRTCYRSEPSGEGSHVPFINMILNRGHESILEHASATFRIVTDRGTSHQIVRHRLASYSQESTRYCNYTKDKFDNQICCIIPRGIINESVDDIYFKQRACLENTIKIAEETYFKLISDGVKPEVARSILPTCLKTEIVMTANFREWRHFLKERMSPAAQSDIREIAQHIYVELVNIAPTVFGEFDSILK